MIIKFWYLIILFNVFILFSCKNYNHFFCDLFVCFSFLLNVHFSLFCCYFCVFLLMSLYVPSFSCPCYLLDSLLPMFSFGINFGRTPRYSLLLCLGSSCSILHSCTSMLKLVFLFIVCVHFSHGSKECIHTFF